MTTYHQEHRLRFQTADGRHPLAITAFELHQRAAARQGQVWSDAHAAAFRELHQAYVLTALGAGNSQRTAWPLAVGTGKTQSLVAFARAQSMTSKPMSLLVCIESVEHISHLHRDMINAGVPADMIGVFHSKGPKEVAAEGYTPATPREALASKPFLIATHNRMLRGQADIALVNTYQGNPRHLIVWDESLIKSQGEYLELVDLEKALGVLKAVVAARKFQNGDASAAAQYVSQCVDLIREFDTQISDKSHIGSRVAAVTSFPPLVDDDAYRFMVGLEAALRGDPMEATARKHLVDFLEACQRPVRLLHGADNGDGIGVLHFETIIPESLRRLIVLDASHNIRALTSRHDTTLRTTLVSCAVKSFDDVNVVHYIQGAGKDKLAAELPRANSPITKRQLKVLAEYPQDEGVIVVTFKPALNGDRSHEDHLRRHMQCAGIDPDATLADGRRRFVFLTWGRHVGVSEYAYCKHTLAVGVLRRKGFDIAAQIIGQRGDLQATHASDPASVHEAVTSEMFHHVIQFAGRGACRTTVNGKAGQMSLTLFCSEAFPEAWWQQTMPGVKVTVQRPDVEARAAQFNADAQVLLNALSELPSDVEHISASTLKVSAGLQSMHSKTYSRLLGKLPLEGWRRAGRGLARVPMFKDETLEASPFIRVCRRDGTARVPCAAHSAPQPFPPEQPNV